MRHPRRVASRRMGMWELSDGTKAHGPYEERMVIEMIARGMGDGAKVRPVGAVEWQDLQSHAPFAVALEARKPRGGRRGRVLAGVAAVVGVLGAIAVFRLASPHAPVPAASVDPARQAADKARQDEADRIAKAADEEAERESQRLEKERRIARLRELKKQIKTSRNDLLDGQCVGAGKPKYAWSIEGALFAENILVAKDAGCEPFQDYDHDNTLNLFCCPLPDMVLLRSLRDAGAR